MADKVGLYTDKELENARQLIRQLVRTVRSARLYESGHPNLEGQIDQLRSRWDQSTEGGPLSLQFTAENVLLDGEVVSQRTAAADILPTALYEHGVVGLVLKRGLEPAEAERLVLVLARENDPTADYASMLWEADLRHVQILLDVGEGAEEPGDPGEFARKLGSITREDDPAAAPDYEEERGEAAAPPRPPASPEADPVALSEGEKLALARMVAEDSYVDTVRRAGEILLALALEEPAEGDPAGLERALQSIAGSMIAAGDLEGAVDFLERAAALHESGRALPMRVGEAAFAAFREPTALRAMLEAVELREPIDLRSLGAFVRRVGLDAIPTLCEWLLDSEHPAEMSHALSLFGPAASAPLAALYQRSARARRDRLASALLKIGTPDALASLASDLLSLPEQQRLDLVESIARMPDPLLRPGLAQGLRDVSERVRRAARGALRKADAPIVASVLPEMLDPAWMGRDEQEVRDFYEALARIGDASIARVLAAECMKGGFSRLLRGLTPAQKLCVRALRRMRSPEARAVVEELSAHGPRPVRDALEDPLADLE
jgi:HEAT repeat protein